MKGMRGLVVERKAVDGIDAEEFHFAGVDEVGERADHALAFEFPLVAGAGGKADERWPIMAVNHDAQFHAQTRRMPSVIFALHACEPLSSTSLSATGRLQPVLPVAGRGRMAAVARWEQSFLAGPRVE